MSQAQPLSTLAPEYSDQFQKEPIISPLAASTAVVIIEPVHIANTSDCSVNQHEQLSAYSHESKHNENIKHDCSNKCPKKRGCNNVYESYSCGWGWIGAMILWFIIFTVLFWLIYYSLKPAFVLQTDSNQVDTAKVLLAAVLSSLFLEIIIWLVKLLITRIY